MAEKLKESKSIQQAAQIIKRAEYVVAMTGAGMSVDSGVNDFRSQSGWWKQIDPRTVATVEALEQNYELFHEFYTARMEQLDLVQPHEGHRILHKWEQQGKLKLIATQNVDGLHQQAGSQQVAELHGSIYRCRCTVCGKSAGKRAFIQKESCSCGGALRPSVVLFGESLPEQAWTHTLSEISRADAVVVIGTSLEVYPVNQLPTMTNGRTIFINKEEVRDQHQYPFDVTIYGTALESLLAIDQSMA